jgi:hypothetical protein
LLGCIWENCDNIGWFLEQILERLENADRSQLDAMMTPDEIKEWRKLPNSITAFRGCSWENAGGMSYSLNEEIAARFPFLVRYYTEEPILLKAKINKRFSVLKLGRNEFEIILTKPKASKLISWVSGQQTPSRIFAIALASLAKMFRTMVAMLRLWPRPRWGRLLPHAL